ncbi:hypothetical protein [Kibdelosporangium philippinense]
MARRKNRVDPHTGGTGKPLYRSATTATAPVKLPGRAGFSGLVRTPP